MVKSMTGFASAMRESPSVTVSVTLRTLNHRFLDLQLRLPSALADLEANLRQMVARRIARGRAELTVSLQLRRPPAVDVEFNEQLGAALHVALEAARARGLVTGALTPGDLLRLPQAVVIRERPAGPAGDAMEETAGLTVAACEEALAALDGMRVTEGASLAADLDARRAQVADLVEQIAGAAEAGRVAVQARLTARVQELSADLQLDRAAVAVEVVRFAARSDISEEVARFRAHVAHWQALTAASEPCGRRLDFLLQEMNREVNTMGSKADGIGASERIVAAKAELEKMREQAENVE